MVRDVERVGDGITLVTEPHVHPLLRCNVWHVRGRDTDIVVDTSLGLRPLRHLVERELDHACSPSPPTPTATTSAGCTSSPNAPIHPAEAAELAAAGRVTLDATVYGERVLGPYRDAGYVVPELLVDAVPPGGLAAAVDGPGRRAADAPAGRRRRRRPRRPGLRGAPPAGALPRQHRAVGGREPACCSPATRVYDGPLLDELDGSDIDDYCATMRRLRDLPVRVVHAGHEPSFGRARLVELCDAYLARRG